MAAGFLHDLKPVLIREGGEQEEVMSVMITAGSIKIRCIVGYGCQENDPIRHEKSENYWDFIEKEIIEAEENGEGVLIQMDANAHTGPTVVKEDKNA